MRNTHKTAAVRTLAWVVTACSREKRRLNVLLTSGIGYFCIFSVAAFNFTSIPWGPPRPRQSRLYCCPNHALICSFKKAGLDAVCVFAMSFSETMSLTPRASCRTNTVKEVFVTKQTASAITYCCHLAAGACSHRCPRYVHTQQGILPRGNGSLGRAHTQSLGRDCQIVRARHSSGLRAAIWWLVAKHGSPAGVR